MENETQTAEKKLTTEQISKIKKDVRKVLSLIEKDCKDIRTFLKHADDATITSELELESLADCLISRASIARADIEVILGIRTPESEGF